MIRLSHSLGKEIFRFLFLRLEGSLIKMILCIFVSAVRFVNNANSFMGTQRKQNHVWILSCFFILDFSINFLSQNEQLNGLSSV